MRRAFLLAFVVSATMIISGCIGEIGSDSTTAKGKALAGKGKALASGLGLVPVETPLWHDPQTAPHPAFNYPTLSNPPQNSENPWLKPIPPATLPSPVAGFKHVAQVKGTTSGAGMSLIGSIAILPSGSGTRLVDISDPTKPQVVGTSEVRSRGSDTIVYPDGRIVAVLATGGRTIGLVDITNPTMPIDLTPIETTGTTHKVDVVPGTPIIYNSARGDIWDASVPERPVKAEKSMPATCHRTYFYISAAENYFRAICAGYAYTHLWDITDPMDPKVVVSIPMWHARNELPPSSQTPTTFSHFAILSDDHKTLIVGDEMGGGAAPACGAHVGTPVRDASTPLGALWFYDVSNEKTPSLKGWLAPRTPIPENQDAFSCTAHHGRLVPDPTGKRDLLAMGWYAAGVLLVDFTDPANPRLVDQFVDGAVWEAWYYNGYVFTGDMRRGLDAIGFR